MKHCYECGTALAPKKCEHEGLVPFCDSCNSFRFPIFSTAVSCIVFNQTEDKILLIQQYGRPDYILVAGYISQGENAEQTVIREIEEETGLTVISHRYMKSEYFEKSNTLIFNYCCVVDSEDLSNTNHEIDKADWFSVNEAKEAIKKGSLAEKFMLNALKCTNSDMN